MSELKSTNLKRLYLNKKLSFTVIQIDLFLDFKLEAFPIFPGFHNNSR